MQMPICYNDDMVLKIRKKCKDVVFAWGAFKEAKEKGIKYAEIFPDALYLYCRDDTKLKPFHL